MIDPKMVELQFYNGLPHLLTPVIVDPQVAPMVLKWTMHEMERRYCMLAEINTRDIERYNEKIDKMKKGGEKLPYIVAIIDEMADLMMSSKEVEGYITQDCAKVKSSRYTPCRGDTAAIGRYHHRSDKGEFSGPHCIPGSTENGFAHHHRPERC